jgi:hypothetical protein
MTERAQLYKKYQDGTGEYFVGNARVFALRNAMLARTDDAVCITSADLRCSCTGFFYRGVCKHTNAVHEATATARKNFKAKMRAAFMAGLDDARADMARTSVIARLLRMSVADPYTVKAAKVYKKSKTYHRDTRGRFK